MIKVKKFIDWVQAKNRLPWLTYGLLSFIVLGPLLLPGYIFALDMVFAPNLAMPSEVSSLYLYRVALHLLNFVLPSQIIQKLLLFAILVLSGIGMHKLVSLKSGLAKYSAGIFYMINPFTYSRFMSGQYLALLGYALVPWFALALFKFIAKPSWKLMLQVSAWALAISLVSLHMLGMALFLASFALILALARYLKIKNYQQLKLVLGLSVAGLAIVFIASSYWLIPALAGKGTTTDLISNFDGRHLVSFRTDSGSYGVPLNVLSLNGFWGDREGFYTLPKDVLPFWHLLSVIMLVIILAGAVTVYKRKRFVALVLLTTLFVAWVLAQGIVGTPFAGVNRWLYGNVPLFTGYREPGKFIALVALPMAYFFGFGVDYLLRKIHGYKTQLYGWALGLAFALPLLYTPSMLWGFGGQLHSVNYPADWYQTNQYLTSKSQGKILFLPWHQYMYFSFADRLIANPAQRFFDAQVIQGDNAEIGLIERQVNNPQSDFIENEILSAGNQTALGEKLSSIGIEYVLLAKEADWQQYQFLDNQPDLQLVQQNHNLKLYRNLSYGGGQ